MLTAGSILKSERLKKEYTLDDVSSATKINQKYLEYLENDQFDKFPSSVYAKGFLQSYAKFLELNVDRVTALYRRNIGEHPPQEIKSTQEPLKQPKFILTPSILVVALIVIIVVSTFGYLIFQFYNFQKPPLLTIESPETNATVEESDITITGSTEPSMFVTINDEAVKVQQTGTFEATIALSKGTNTIIVKARHPDNIGKEAVVTLKIEHVPPDEETDEATDTDTEETPEEEEVTELTEFTLDLAIGAENAWIEVEVDGQQVFASVAPAQSSYSYTAEKSVYVRTGKTASTTITIDDEPQNLFTEGGGVSSIMCELENQKVNCHEP